MTEREKANIAIYQGGYEQGQWDMFQLVTSTQYGKQVYFEEPSGVVYSRVTHSYLKSREEAIEEYFEQEG